MTVNLNIKNFSYFAFDPNSQRLSIEDQNKALAATIIMGVFTFGIGHLIAGMAYMSNKQEIQSEFHVMDVKQSAANNFLGLSVTIGKGLNGIIALKKNCSAVESSTDAKTQALVDEALHQIAQSKIAIRSYLSIYNRIVAQMKQQDFFDTNCQRVFDLVMAKAQEADITLESTSIETLLPLL